MKELITFLREGDQFILDLFPGSPWSGRSPRGLTRGRKGLFLRPEPPGHEVDPDPMQLSLWAVPVRPPRGKQPQQAAGASTLLPLKEPRASARGSRRGCLRWRDSHGT